MPASPIEENSLGYRLGHNVFLNLLGRGAPLLVALFAVPVLIRALGTERYGVLTIAWMLLGYFSMFDLGISRALTKVVAEFLTIQRDRELDSLVWSALILAVVLGLIGSLMLASISPWLIEGALRIPPDLRDEALRTFYLLAYTLPFVVTSSAFFGFLEGHQRFDLTNMVRGIMGGGTFLAPLLVLPFSCDLFSLTASMVIVRILAWLSLVALCVRLRQSLLRGITINLSAMKKLISFGGWITVTSIVGPLMDYFDRFLIGMMVSMSAVAFYTTPYDVVTKLNVFPAAVVGVLFPIISASFMLDRNRASEVFETGVKFLFIILFPISLLTVSFAAEGLTIWLGSEFAHNSALVLQLLTIGTFFNCLAYVPFALIQGAGRPDITAKLHLFELPSYLLIVYVLIYFYGIEGAAFAWLVRVAFDTILLFLLAQRFLSNSMLVKVSIVPAILAASLILILALTLGSIYIKLTFTFLFVLVFAMICFSHVLSGPERAAIKGIFRQLVTIGQRQQ